MLFAHIDIADKYNYLNDRFRKALSWLRDNNLETIPLGRYEIDKDLVFANVQEFDTAPAQEKHFEAHNKYFDLQYVVSGTEKFGVCKRDQLQEIEARLQDDVWFYADPESAEAGFLILTPGDMAIVAPEDAHKPGCAVEAPVHVRKVVIKVAV